MDARAAGIWADALESGKYRQIKGKLEARLGYNCCLGVACRAAIADGIRVDVVPPGTSATGTTFDGCGGDLPPAVAEWLGLDERDGTIETTEDGVRFVPNPYLVAKGLRQTATHMNDTAGLTFDEIAKLVREKVAEQD